MPIEETGSGTSPAIALLRERLAKFETEGGRLKGLSYQPRPNDVAISTTPKAGTTWMQQICHQIRSADAGGDMNFDEISRVVPWLELAVDQGQDLEAEQYGEKDGNKPRLFKTHAWADHCPPFSKTIVVLRHPFDVVVSFYRFFEGWFFEPDSIDLDSFANEFWLARGVPVSKMQNASYFVHLVSWYKKRNDSSVLIVFFEDLKEDLPSQVQRVARFLSNDTQNFDKPEIIQLATEYSSYEFMKKHESHFDEKISKLTRNEACGLPLNAGMNGGKLASGKVGSGSSMLSDELKNQIMNKWKDVVEPVTKCATYEELRKQLRNSSC